MKITSRCTVLLTTVAFSYAATMDVVAGNVSLPTVPILPSANVFKIKGASKGASKVTKGTKRGTPKAKGIKGSAPKGMPIGGGDQDVGTHYYYLRSDRAQEVFDTGNGYAFAVDLYEPGKEKPVGIWYESVTYTEPINKGNATNPEKSGLGIASMTFNKNAMISLSVVVGQHRLPIIGASGKYGPCTSGFAVKRPVTGEVERARANFQLKTFETC